MTTSIEQVARLLTEIPYIEAHPGITMAEVARTFSVSVAQVRKDISVAIFCGLPGGYPSDLIDVDLEVLDDEGCVYLTNPTTLDRPLRMTMTEAASLHLALMAVRSLVDEDTARVIDALIDKIAFQAAPSVDLNLSAGDEEVRQTISLAITQAQRLDLTYEGGARGKTTHLLVDPASLYASEGVGYLSAYCVSRVEADQDLLAESEQAPGWRTYRLDRITEARLTAEPAEPHGREDPESWAKSLAMGPTVRLTVSDEAAWIAEYHPTSSVSKRDDGTTVIELPVVEQAWLARLLLGLGSQVSRVEPESYTESAREMARQTLNAYERLVSTVACSTIKP